MDLSLLEEAAWRALPRVKPSEVARAVDALRGFYVGGDPIPRGPSLSARLLFFGIADAAKVGVLLSELRSGDALPEGESWRVLDLGAGPGSTGLALLEWLRATARRTAVTLVAIDRDREALHAGARLHASYRALGGPAARYEPILCDLAQDPPPEGPFDLVLCANLLCELGHGDADPTPARTALLERALGRLAPAGSLLAIEPALRRDARILHQVRDRLLASGATVFAPCLRGAPCPMLAASRDWCHEDRPVELPERTRLVARLAGLRRHTLKFSYLTLRRDGRRLGDAYPEASFRVVSELLVSKGREEVFVCGEPGRLRILRNRRDRTESNRPFGSLGRGQLVRLGGEKVARDDAVEAWDPARPARGDA